MAKQAVNSEPVFSVGDRVEIYNFGPGKITALHGRLGPRGEQVYRIVYRSWPRPAYIYVLESQIKLAKKPKRPDPAE